MRAAWLVACAALAASACAAPGRYQAEVARQRALGSDLVECRKGMLDESRGKEKLIVEKDALDAERAQLVKQIESERAGVSALREALEHERTARAIKEDEIDRIQGTYQGLIDSLQGEVKSGQLQIEKVKDRLVVRATDKVLFDSGSAELKSAGRPVLAKIAAGIKGMTDREIRVEGHTDSVPIKSAHFASNLDLSAARAASVARFLASNGVPAKNLAAVGYGEGRPIAGNDSADGRQRNRRIEIVLAPFPLD
ncbi:MAG TPA: OmpA family protein [Myxococcota bacterium]|nr:OmpA family protein [Myxococcota bacterium]